MDAARNLALYPGGGVRSCCMVGFSSYECIGQKGYVREVPG